MMDTANSPRPFPYLSNLSSDDEGYLECHSARFKFTLDLVHELVRNDPQLGGRKCELRILDVGPHFMTMILRQETRAVVNQLGFPDSYEPCRPRPNEHHFTFDLDETVNRMSWPKVRPHHIVIAAEVVEHLHTSPNHWLPFLQSCLVPGGYLILTTPNGVALKRRLLMLAGRHPYELIRDNPRIPGHFREYTRAELTDYGRRHGLMLIRFACKNHLRYPSVAGRLYNLVQRPLPASFRDSMYLVFRNDRPPTSI